MNGQHPPSQSAESSYMMPLYDTTALTWALANPYAQHTSPHYYQAYVQAYSNPRPRTTPDGYTLSSTYVPRQTGRAPPTLSPRDRPTTQTPSQPSMKPILNHLTFGSWYQSGNCRCTRQGCPFTGSRKSVEIHMMDRHFIFPPGWQKKNDWDADPSLRGKPIAIQGTSLVLDTSEAVNAWVAERKRRFPTNERAQDKKRKLEEAVARGQLAPDDMGVGARKKHKQNMILAEGGYMRFRGRGHQRGRGRRWQGPVQHEDPRTENVCDPASQLIDAGLKCIGATCPDPVSTADDDEAPEVVSSKIPSASPKVDAGHDDKVQVPHAHSQESPKRIPQPKKPPRNPFASRSTLLRNVLQTCYSLALTANNLTIKLLLPEIRVTVSNLSQAIHFLVENDFLRGVELRPGEAQEQMIEVLGNSRPPCSAQIPLPEALLNTE